ncbi:MAG TPA: SurA N-terminal domain-containing protein [Anaerolineae bacterium]|nr:SurA N-terminal domain-containing protein [Anaerolineae bacterium]
MSKRPQASPLPKELSRKHISRAQRDAQRTRILLFAVGGAVVVAILLIAFGFVRETFITPNEPVAIVGNEQILTRQFQQRVRLNRYQLLQQYSLLQSFGSNDSAAQVLQQLNDSISLGSQAINALVNEAIYRQAAPSLGVAVTQDEVDKLIEEGFGYYRNPPTPAPTSTPRPTPTVPPDATPTPNATATATATPRPTSTPITAEGFQSLYQARLSELAGFGFNEADFRRLFEMQLISERVQDIIVSDVPTMTEQATFQFIRALSQSDIEAVQQAIAEEGFDAVYAQALSQTLPISNVLGSELPFLPKEDLIESPAFGAAVADAVFTTPISDMLAIVTDPAGVYFYVGRVPAREVRELAPDALERRQAAAIEDWLTRQREQLNAQVLTWEDRVPNDP